MTALTLHDVAARLGTSVRQVRRYLADPLDPLPSLRLGRRCRRVEATDLAAWMARRRDACRRSIEPGLFAGFSDDARAALESIFGATATEVQPVAAARRSMPCPATPDPLITTQRGGGAA